MPSREPGDAPTGDAARVAPRSVSPGGVGSSPVGPGGVRSSPVGPGGEGPGADGPTSDDGVAALDPFAAVSVSADGRDAPTPPRPGDPSAFHGPAERPPVPGGAEEGREVRAGTDPAPPRPEGAPPVREAGGCTTAQLRRFIKSRAWIPMHELRRRFSIDGVEDDVLPVRLPRGGVFVGLPEREAQMLGELFRSGDVGFELSHDPESPIVIGVYPMRPVIRG